MSYSDNDDAFIDDQDEDDDELIQHDHDSYQPSPSGDDSTSFISASSSSRKLTISIEFDLDFHQNIESKLVPITTLPTLATPPSSHCPDPPSALTQQKHPHHLPPSTQLPSPVVSNDTTINTCTTTTSITLSPSKLKSKYPLYKSPIQPKNNEVLPAFVKLDKRKNGKYRREWSFQLQLFCNWQPR
jgi:hypothetical protein